MSLLKNLYRCGTAGKPVKHLRGTAVLSERHPIEKVVKAFETAAVVCGERGNLEEKQGEVDGALGGLKDALLTAAFLVGDDND